MKTQYKVMNAMAATLTGQVVTWSANKHCAAPAPTLQLSSTTIAKTHTELAKLGLHVSMTGKTYKKPKPGESEPVTHSWFVASSTATGWFVIKFTNADFGSLAAETSSGNDEEQE